MKNFNLLFSSKRISHTLRKCFFLLLCLPISVFAATITGTVTVDGAPASGVSVSAWPQSGGSSISGTSGADGSFSLTVSDNATYYFSANKENCLSPSIPSVAVTTGGKDIGTVKLLTMNRTISGTVTLPATGTNPSYVSAQATIGGAWYSVGSYSNGAIDPTNPTTGAYSLNLAAGDWTLTVYKSVETSPGYFSFSSDARYPSPSVSVIDNRTGIDISMLVLGTLTGTVTVDGTPTAGISVSAWPQSEGSMVSGTSGADGSFSLEVADNKTYSVSASSPTYLAPSSQTVTVTSGSGSLSTPIRLLTKVNTSGTVALPATGTKPSYVSARATIGGVSYNVRDSVIDPTTGAYSLNLAAGNWTLTVYKSVETSPGYFSFSSDDRYLEKNLTVAGDPLSGVNFSVLNTIATGTISGQITINGVALGSATVRASRYDNDDNLVELTATTGPGGNYSINIPNGYSYTLSFESSDKKILCYYEQALSISDGNKVCDFPLPFDKKISGVLKKLDGITTDSGATVKASGYFSNNNYWGEISSEANDQGEYSLSVAGNANWDLSIESSVAAYVSRTVSVGSANVPGVDFRAVLDKAVYTITVSGASVTVNRWGTGAKALVFFNHSGPMKSWIEELPSTMSAELGTDYSMFLWDYPEIAPFTQVNATLTGWQSDKATRLPFPGVASSVVTQLKTATGLSDFCLVGNSLGAGVILSDYATLSGMQGVRLVLISPTEPFLPATFSENSLLEKTVLVSNPSSDYYVSSPIPKAFLQKNCNADSFSSWHMIIEDASSLSSAFDLVALCYNDYQRSVQTWRKRNFDSISTTGSAAANADFSGDGMSNLLKFALGGSPSTPSRELMPNSEMRTVGEQSRKMVFKYRKMRDNGLSYIVQSSDNLVDWTTVSDGEDEGTVDRGAGVDEKTLLVPAPASGKRFLRLRVTDAP